MSEIVNKVIPIDALKPHPRNYKKHPEKQIGRLRASVARFGQVRSVVAQSGANGNYLLVAGHGLTKAAREEGLTELRVDVIPADWTPAQVEGYLLSDNLTANGAEDDNTLLAEILQEQANLDYDLASLGSSQEELDALLAMLAEDALGELPEVGDGGDEFDPDKEEIPERCKSGELWALGEHRLLIGDCRNPDDVARLLDGYKINVVVTSPPYASQRKYDEESGFKPIKPDDYSEWFSAVQANIKKHLAEDGSYFLNIKEHCEDGQRHLYVKYLTIDHVMRWGWRLVDEFVWHSESLPGSWPNRFRNSWEPVFHFCKQAKIKFYPLEVGHASASVRNGSGGLSKTEGGNWTLDAPLVDGIAQPSNVLKIGKNSDTVNHSAAYPVGLPEFFIKAFSDENDIIFDPFLGSGTTMIAAQRNKRKCYGTELSAKYGDVIIARYEKETGQTAKLLERVEQPELVTLVPD